MSLLSSKILSASLCFFLTTAPSTAHAQETVSLEPKIVEVDGVKGDWFTPRQSERIIFKLQKTDRLRRLSESQGALIKKQKDLIRTATTSLYLQTLSTDAEKERGDKLKDLAETQAEELKNARAWYRSPALWTSIGTVLGIGLTIGTFILARKAQQLDRDLQ